MVGEKLHGENYILGLETITLTNDCDPKSNAWPQNLMMNMEKSDVLGLGYLNQIGSAIWPEKNGCNTIMKVWKMLFLCKCVISRFRGTPFSFLF